MHYKEDILGNNFEQCSFELSDDYEGRGIATLVRCLVQKGKCTRAVLYIHGFNDYFFQTEMAIRFNDKGYNFYALDLRKYGRSYLSHQKMNDVRNLKDYYEEMTIALNIIREEGNTTTFLIGHSTGGLICTLYAKDNMKSSLFNGLILNSPFFEINKPSIVLSLLPIAIFFGKLFPSIKISGGFSEEYGKGLHEMYNGEWAYNLDWKPNVPPKVNLGWLRAIWIAQRELKKPFTLGCPVLVLHSSQSSLDVKHSINVESKDIILNVDHIKDISGNIRGDVKVVAIEGGIHDLVLSKKEVRDKVYNTIFGWLEGFLK